MPLEKPGVDVFLPLPQNVRTAQSEAASIPIWTKAGAHFRGLRRSCAVPVRHLFVCPVEDRKLSPTFLSSRNLSK